MIMIRYGLILGMIFLSGSKAWSGGYAEWQERRDLLKEDETVARYYTFEGVEDSKSKVEDLSGNGADLVFVPYVDRKTKEVFDDLQVVEGRWKEKRAVRLDRGFYRGPTLNIKNKAFTAEVWFRRLGPGSILPASNLRNGHILSVSGYRQGWRIVTTYDPVSGVSFSLGMEGGHNKAKSILSVKAAMPDNIWHHLAVSWDGREMKIYLNGEEMGVHPLEKDYVPVEAPELFKVGFAEMGVGTLKLDIDEIVIYNRVLTAGEIKERGKGPAGVSEEDVFDRADAFLRAGNYAAARKEYEKLKGLTNYGKELALFNIAESYRIEKDYSGAHRTYDEIMELEGLTAYYRIYGLFRQAEVCLEQKDYARARQLYGEVAKTEGALGRHLFNGRLFTGDTYKAERKHSRARALYEKLLREEESSSFPNDGYRLELRDRLEEIDGLADGEASKSRQEKMHEWINSTDAAIYVSLRGSDANPGTKEKPFATIERAREEVRKLKGKNIGVTVYLRGGRYFLDDALSFGPEDSGWEGSPAVYRGFPGEEVRIIGGKEVKGFKLLEDPGVLEKLPENARGSVWVADLKESGITDYGKLVNRGFGAARPGALEIIFNGKIMTLARWPNDGWLRVAGITRVDGVSRNAEYQKGKFVYSGDRPERWKGEKEIWVKGYLGVNQPYALTHMKVSGIDTGEKTISLLPNTLPGTHPGWAEGPVAKNHPYYVYNLLSELDAPGEWYLDRDTGKLYFYPPGDIKESEVIAATLDKPLAVFDGASNIVLFGLVLEGTWRHGVEIKGGRNNIVAACTIRNTGQWAVSIKSGWGHTVTGCDMYDMGEGGVALDGGDRKKLIPGGHTVENNHIYRFNRFCGGYRQAAQINGIGQRVSHNVMHDSPHQMIYFNANDHVIEYNELHDGPHEGREIGAMYIYGEPWYLMSRGTVTRNNFFHHISVHSSPNLTHGLNGIHVDAMNAGLVFTGNIFYRCPTGISSTYPGNYLTNNIFADCEGTGIGQGDRSYIFCKDRNIDAGPNLSIVTRLAARLNSVRYKQPPWSWRYPPLVGMMEKEPAVWGKIQGSIIERNVNTGGRFVSFGRGTQATTHFTSNWDGQNPLFADKEKMDFNIRPGSPVYGLTGCEPVKMEDIGVYKDALRASWPISRKKEDIGKYYGGDWSAVGEMRQTMKAVKRVAPPVEYTVAFTGKPVVIDGMAEEKEWLGLEKKNAMVIERYYTGEEKKGPATYAWVLYDSDYLYISMMHEPDPWTSNMPPRAKDHAPSFEVAIESQYGPHSREWWMEDMPTGPIYILWGYFDGKHEVKNNFKMPFEIVSELEKAIEYKCRVIDREKLIWVSEMKIPLDKIGINPGEVDRLAFNIGVSKRGGWFAWVPTGASIWRIENAGLIKFGR